MDKWTESSQPDATETYAPNRLLVLAEESGVAKAKLSITQTLMLGILAGAFIAFGAMFYTVVMTESALGYGPGQMLGGIAFSLGLILVIVGGAELFSGNNLLAIAWAEQLISTRALLRNWTLVYVGNLIGAPIRDKLIHYLPSDEAAKVKDCAALFIVAEKEELFDNKDHAKLAYDRMPGTKKKYVSIPNITHYGIYRESRDQAIKLAVEWFDQYLKK